MADSAPHRPGLRASILHPGRWPLRWRLTAVLAGLSCLILVGFALVVGRLASNRLHNDFDGELSAGAQAIAAQIPAARETLTPSPIHVPHFDEVATAPLAYVRLVYFNGHPLPNGITPGAPYMGRPRPGIHVPWQPSGVDGGGAGRRVRADHLRPVRPHTQAPSRPRSASCGSSSSPASSPARFSPPSPATPSPGGRSGRSHSSQRPRATSPPRATRRGASPSRRPRTRSLSSRERSTGCSASSTPRVPRRTR